MAAKKTGRKAAVHNKTMAKMKARGMPPAVAKKFAKRAARRTKG